MECIVRLEAGYKPALYGMAFSHRQLSEYEIDDKMISRAEKLAPMQGGHNKFLESIMLWIEVNAPRYWWQQADTYRLSTKQSGSTMHTIMKRPLKENNFSLPPPSYWIDDMNKMIADKNFDYIKALLPEGFMQRRMWLMSYKTLQNIYIQRRNHKLQEWRYFLSQTLEQIEHPEFIINEESETKL